MILMFCMPQLSTVTSEIMPMLSPKQEPPAMAQTVRPMLPPTIWFSQRKMGAQAAKVPQEEPVATDSSEQTSRQTGAMVRAETPSFKDRLIMAAPTPVFIKHSPTVVANMRMKKMRMMFFVASMPCSKASPNLTLVVSI